MMRSGPRWRTSPKTDWTGYCRKAARPDPALKAEDEAPINDRLVTGHEMRRRTPAGLSSK
jgi:hypothetical protein